MSERAPHRRSDAASSEGPAPIWRRAAARWFAVSVVLSALYLLYFHHPYYRGQQFSPFKSLFKPAFGLWLCLGIFYVKATLERFAGMRYAMRDGPLHLIMLGRLLVTADGEAAPAIRRAWIATGVFGAGAFAADLLGQQGGAAWLSEEAARPKLASASLWLGVGTVALGAFAVLLTLARSRARERRRFARLVKNRRVRTTLLAIVVKAFFIPLMTGFVVSHLNAISRAWLTRKGLPPLEFKVPSGTDVFGAVELWWQSVGSRLGDLLPSLHDLAALAQPWAWSRADLSWGLGLTYDIIFAVDCGFALFGYASESRWLDNKTKSVDPTALGWLVCLACYPPFNNVLGTYMPLERGVQHITDSGVLLGLRVATVLLFAIYAGATVAFGARFSNLTNRGIVTRGPYRLVRHPAYLCKCLAWWLEHLPTMSIVKAFFLTLLCGVYALRAWTEERHLDTDPEYRAYKKKVPWVLVPGVY